MYNSTIPRTNQQWNTLINSVRNQNRFLSAAQILKAIEICLEIQTDNLGRPFSNFFDAVCYRARQIKLAIG